MCIRTNICLALPLLLHILRNLSKDALLTCAHSWKLLEVEVRQPEENILFILVFASFTLGTPPRQGESGGLGLMGGGKR